MWWILLALAVACLAIYRRGPNAVWGTATVSVVIGLMVVLLKGWSAWESIWHSFVIGALIGTVFELLPKLVDKR